MHRLPLLPQKGGELSAQPTCLPEEQEYLRTTGGSQNNKYSSRTKEMSTNLWPIRNLQPCFYSAKSDFSPIKKIGKTENCGQFFQPISMNSLLKNKRKKTKVSTRTTSRVPDCYRAILLYWLCGLCVCV